MSIAADIARSVADLPEQKALPECVFSRITPAIYGDLRRLARCFMRGERSAHTLQPTAVLNEACLRLSQCDIHLNNATHVFRLVARNMRRVLVDHARERRRIKRNTPDADTFAMLQCPPVESTAPLDILDIDAALDALAERAPRAAIFLELRYFAGLDDIEISELCGVSRPTVERDCRFAKAFFMAYAKRKQVQSRYTGTAGSSEIDADD
jgi:RNA polymerase sigma-70 factor, ECF subfamily